MSTKLGNGGHGLETYDPETGRYIKEDLGSDGLKKYHAGAHFGVEKIKELITDGFYGDDIKNAYLNGDDSYQSDMIGYFQTKLDSYYTKKKLANEQTFDTISSDEFAQFGIDNKNANSQADLSYFYNYYVGTGVMSFEFNKALRMGIDNYLSRFPNGLKQAGYNSMKEFDDQIKAFDNLTKNWKAPKNLQVFRYVTTGPLVSWFKGSGVLDGLATEDDGYGYLQLSQGYELEDLKQRLSKLIGSIVPEDGAFSSFSCVKNASHMKKNTNRNIEIRYNVPKGKNLFISQYNYESEGCFPRDTEFVIQNVEIENGRIVLYYGVK